MGELWAVTAYFNPLSYATRLANYHVFREHLRVPLLAIELGFDERFDLDEDAADVVICRAGRDILWHKERLLNEAIVALPGSCDRVAWLDADIVFVDNGWAERLTDVLDHCRLVQPFARFHRLGEGEPLSTSIAERPPDGFSLVHLLTTGALPDDTHWSQGGTSTLHRYTPGFAWAARRADVEAVGLYDALILGSGDRAFLSAACGRQKEFVVKLGMNPHQADHYLAWAGPVAAQFAGDIASLDGDVVHLWHGDVRDRAYCARYEELSAHDFDPHVDIVRDKAGSWHWASEKPALHSFVERYFRDRSEGVSLDTFDREGHGMGGEPSR
jgi:hypothetical protein